MTVSLHCTIVLYNSLSALFVCRLYSFYDTCRYAPVLKLDCTEDMGRGVINFGYYWIDVETADVESRYRSCPISILNQTLTTFIPTTTTKRHGSRGRKR